MAVSDAKKKANKKWDEKNKARKNYINKRSAAKSFIRKSSTLEDLKILKQLISERATQLKDKIQK